MSSQMLAALEAAVLAHTFPKSNVDVYCLILESGGSDLAVCISAACLALADGGIEMRDLVSACRIVSLWTSSADNVTSSWSVVSLCCKTVLTAGCSLQPATIAGLAPLLRTWR